MIHDLTSNCWGHNPHKRPAMKTVVNILRVETVFLTNHGSSRRSDDIVSSCIMTSRSSGLSSGLLASSSSSLSRGFGLFGSQPSFESTNTTSSSFPSRGFGLVGSQPSFDSKNTTSSSKSSSFPFPLIKRSSTTSISKTAATATATATQSSSSYISSYKSYGSMISFANKTRNRMQMKRTKNNIRENFVWKSTPPQQQQQTTVTQLPTRKQQLPPQQEDGKKITPTTTSSSTTTIKNGMKIMPTTLPKCRNSLLYSSVFGKVGNTVFLRRRNSLSSLSSFTGKNLLSGSASVASSSSSQNLYTLE